MVPIFCLLDFPFLLFFFPFLLTPLLPLIAPHFLPLQAAGAGQTDRAPPPLQLHSASLLRELRGGVRVAAEPHAAATTAGLAVVETFAFRAAGHQANVVVAGAARQAERQQKEGPLCGSGSPHLLLGQDRLGVGAVSAHFYGEGGGRTHLVPAEVELEEVVEEVVRAMRWEAAVKKIEVCVLLPPGPRAERPGSSVSTKTPESPALCVAGA
mmetsp:Transcript_26501/g.70672  ORF Transcript_26501/g.70672 Transcript_26501/m.70672 type:complete len:211 (-) Transcript_26501:60-692(-)